MSEKRLLSLRHPSGISVQVDPVGAALREVQVLNAFGNFSNIALCPLPPAPPVRDASYAGTTLAPCAGRIPQGRLQLEVTSVQLPLNDGANHLHGGGTLSFAKWETTGVTPHPQGEQCSFRFFAVDGLDGYPGNREFTVTYTLARDGSLCISYRAVSDRPTWVNLSNHAYWNLSGDFTGTVHGHRLQLASREVYANDEAHLPVSRQPVGGTAFDFRAPRSLAEAMEMYPQDRQLAIARGYNHTFVLEGSGSGDRRPEAAPAATITEDSTGRRLRLYTDYPALVLYTGGYLQAGMPLCGGGRASPSCALALEPQELPGSASCLLHPGEVRQRLIRFVFDTV